MSLKSLLLSAVLVAAPAFVQAATVTVEKGNAWTEFRFWLDYAGGEFVQSRQQATDAGDDPNAPEVVEYVVTLASAAYLQITDAFLSGDRFNIFSNGSLLGSTSNPLFGHNIGDQNGVDWDEAYNDPDNRWSTGQFLLGAGTHRITGIVTQQPFDSNDNPVPGRGALRIVDAPAPIPLPAGFSLMLGAGAAMAGVSYAKKRKQRKA